MALKISRALLSAFFIVAGANHFLSPDVYVPMIPPYLPWPLALVYLSGVAEVIGGVGVPFQKSRRLAGWWLIAVMVAVFPANIHMLVNQIPLAGKAVPEWILWLRLPLQGLFIYWIYASCVRKPQETAT